MSSHLAQERIRLVHKQHHTLPRRRRPVEDFVNLRHTITPQRRHITARQYRVFHPGRLSEVFGEHGLPGPGRAVQKEVAVRRLVMSEERKQETKRETKCEVRHHSVEVSGVVSGVRCRV